MSSNSKDQDINQYLEQLQHLQLITDKLPVLIAYVDSDLKYRFSNETYREWWGREESDLTGLSMSQVLTDEIYSRITQHLDRVLGGEEIQLDIATRYPHCGVRYMQVLYRPHMDDVGQVHGFIILAMDLTERRQAEKALEDSETRLRQLVEKTKVIPWEASAENWCFTYVGPQATGILGYDLNDWYQPSFWVDHIHPDDREWTINYCREQSAICDEYEFEYRMIRADGEVVWLHDYVSVQHENGKPKTLSGFLIDITERKQAEVEMLELENQLRQSQKMEALGTLAGGIAHDFNNILSVILGYTELALGKTEQLDGIQEYLEQTHVSASRAKDLVRQILVFSQRAEPNLELINFTQVLNEVLDLIKAVIPASINIVRNFDIDTPLHVIGCASQLHQVILNLCTNAGHAMKEQGGELRVELISCDPLEIDPMPEDLVESSKWIKFVIKDSGHGIADDALDRIFEPYYTTKPVSEGSGLGLSVVHGIMASHGGAMLVDSKEGEGTVFTGLLPETQASSLRVVKTETNSEPAFGHILFVDDEEAVAVLGKEMLEFIGYTVKVCTCAEEALNVFQNAQEDFDLVMTDQTMPGASGDVLIRRLRKLSKDVPVILTTGYSDKIDKAEALRIGATDFLLKPYSIDKLKEVIGIALGQESYKTVVGV